MSVSLIISNPMSKYEDNLYVPISTESRFEIYWYPIIINLNLKWVRCFQSGIELEKEDFVVVLKELEKMRNWIIKNENDIEYKKVIERIDVLCKTIQKFRSI